MKILKRKMDELFNKFHTSINFIMNDLITKVKNNMNYYYTFYNNDNKFKEIIFNLTFYEIKNFVEMFLNERIKQNMIKIVNTDVQYNNIPNIQHIDIDVTVSYIITNMIFMEIYFKIKSSNYNIISLSFD